MAKNKKEEPFLSPTSMAINELIRGKYNGLSVSQVIDIIEKERKDQFERKKPKDPMQFLQEIVWRV